MTEEEVREALYGPQTRSGEVLPAPLAYDIYDSFRGEWVRPWMDWNSVVWFPRGKHSVAA